MSVAYAPIARKRSVPLRVPELRVAGGAMLAAAVVLPELPLQPGLGCLFRSVTGIPCPLCGMTTSVEATVHGHLGAAAAATPAGIVAVAVAVWLLVRPPRGIEVSTPVVMTVLLLMWVFQLFRFQLLSV